MGIAIGTLLLNISAREVAHRATLSRTSVCLDNEQLQLRITFHVSPRRCGRVAEGGGLLNR